MGVVGKGRGGGEERHAIWGDGLEFNTSNMMDQIQSLLVHYVIRRDVKADLPHGSLGCPGGWDGREERIWRDATRVVSVAFLICGGWCYIYIEREREIMCVEKETFRCVGASRNLQQEGVLMYVMA